MMLPVKKDEGWSELSHRALEYILNIFNSLKGFLALTEQVISGCIYS